MAAVARSAPLPPETIALVEDPQSQEIVQRSRSLIQKILLFIPVTHKSCIHSEALQLNSTENERFALMASTIGIPAAPAIRTVSENFTLEACLRRVSEGLQLHRALLISVSPRLKNTDKVTELLADIKDLIININKLLKMIQKEAPVQPSPTPMSLRLPGDYEVQLAAHLTLVQLQAFGQDVVRCLRSLDQSNEEEEGKN
ncbi:uncharacterized protein V6R79_004752 [Siganus canaliculatus]